MGISSQKFRNYRPFLKPLLFISILAGLSFGIFFFVINHWLNTLFVNVEIQHLQSLQQIVSVARNSIEPILHDVRAGKISPNEARKRIRALLRTMTYMDQYGRNYIFMSAYDGTMLVQPFEPEKEMTNQWDLRDSNGLYIIRELVRAAKENPEGAFVRYYYHLPVVHGTQEKLAYVIGLPELQCYIGTGMYTQRAIENQKEILKKIGSASVVLFVILLIPIFASLVFILIRNRLLLAEIITREQVEKELKESESKYRSIFENAVEGIFQTTPDGRLIKVNPAFARIAGYDSPQDMIDSKTGVEEYYADSSERQELLKALKNSGSIADYKIRMTHRDGHYIWLSINARIVKDEQGKIQYYEGTIEDITERRLAEDNVRASRKMLSDILQAASEFAIIATDPKGMITIFNSGAEKMLGYAAHEVIGKHTPLIFHLESEITERSRELTAELGYQVNGLRAFIIKSEQEGLADTREWTFVRKDGTHLAVSLVFTAIRSERNEITGYLGIASDITIQKQAEAMSRHSEEKFSKVFMTTPDFIGITRMSDGKIIDVNKGFEEITGWRRESVIGRTSSDIKFWANPLERDLMVEQLKSGKDVLHCEFQFQKKGGELRTGIYSARTIEIVGEECLIFIMQDITEQKQLEEERQKLAQQLFQSQKLDAVGKLAGGVAHDFNNILTGIQGNTSLMLMNLKPDHPHYRRLRIIEEQISRGAHLTRQLLGFAREGKYEVKTISINDLIRKSAQFFIETRKEIEADLQLQNDIYPVAADAGQIEQVLVNLYINAGHAMPKGGRLHIQTSNITLTELDAEAMEIKPGLYVKISVTDTGIGMDRETLKRIFEPFFTTKSKEGGTGLGLASAYGIIRNHGGLINAYSEPGQGATFNIYLPSSSPKEEEAEPEFDKGASAGSGGVLLVDDESMILDTASELLRMLGYIVFRAGSGQEAVSVYHEKKSRIDLVILDMIMPGMSGAQVLKLLKEINPDIKVILSSGYSMQGEVQKVMESGCAAFIQKPYNFKELSNVVQQVMQGAGC